MDAAHFVPNYDSGSESERGEVLTKTIADGVKRKTSEFYKNFEKFLNTSRFINNKDKKDTNIFNKLGHGYNIPLKKIDDFFGYLESCRRTDINMSMAEKQQDISGIMIDLDILQIDSKSSLTDRTLQLLCTKITSMLRSYIKYDGEIMVGVSKKPKPRYDAIRKCYKDGCHLLIPDIHVSKQFRSYFLSQLKESHICDIVFKSLDIPEGLFKKDFVDQASAYVPVFFAGHSTKAGSPPYNFTHVFRIHEGCATRDINFLNDVKINISQAFSVNYSKKSINVLLKAEVYDSLASYVPKKVVKTNEFRIHGELSILTHQDHGAIFVKDLLDILHPSRAENYVDWRIVLCILANTAKSYKPLAEYFSRKCPSKYSQAGFNQTWEEIINNKHPRPKTIASLCEMAKKDNPEKYQAIRISTVEATIKRMVHDKAMEGFLDNADVAKLLHLLLKNKYVVDVPMGEQKFNWYEFIMEGEPQKPGEIYKWRECVREPSSMMVYISTVLPGVYATILGEITAQVNNTTGVIQKYYKKIQANFKTSARRLKNNTFASNTLKSAQHMFSQTSMGFCEKLNSDDMLMGVGNGVLKLGIHPELITGFHTYKISKYTPVNYVKFDPTDDLTKKILLTLRNMMPDDEPDTFNFLMHFLASTLDGRPKESIFLMIVGQGSNGKSFLMELHKAAIGNHYGQKISLSSLTEGGRRSAESASPALMQLKGARFAYYSETNRSETLNLAKIKELTGGETLSGRKLHKGIVNFKPRCHHIACSNYDFIIPGNDHGTWRRMYKMHMKIKFVDLNRENITDSRYQRPTDSTVTSKWSSDPDILSRYLGILVWYHKSLMVNYKGLVKAIPIPHIAYETDKFRRKQDLITDFIKGRLVSGNDSSMSLTQIVAIYQQWHISRSPNNKAGLLQCRDRFRNSIIGPLFNTDRRESILIGHRILATGEEKADGEAFVYDNALDEKIPENNFGVIPESPENYVNNMEHNVSILNKKISHMNTDRRSKNTHIINSYKINTRAKYVPFKSCVEREDILELLTFE